MLHFISSHPIDLMLSRNPTLAHLLLSGPLDSLLCDVITLTCGLAFFLSMTRTVAAGLLFLSGRAYPSLNFLPPFSFCLTSTLIT